MAVFQILFFTSSHCNSTYPFCYSPGSSETYFPLFGILFSRSEEKFHQFYSGFGCFACVPPLFSAILSALSFYSWLFSTPNIQSGLSSWAAYFGSYMRHSSTPTFGTLIMDVSHAFVSLLQEAYLGPFLRLLATVSLVSSIPDVSGAFLFC